MLPNRILGEKKKTQGPATSLGPNTHMFGPPGVKLHGGGKTALFSGKKPKKGESKATRKKEKCKKRVGTDSD